MIVQWMCTPLLVIVKGFIGLLPVFSYLPNSIVNVLDLLLKAIQFFPIDVWIVIIGNIVFWLTSQLLFAILHFVAGLIPCLNIRFG
ncbi:MAG: hypothetical protein ACLU8F_02975 [Clostridia bacterium]